MDAEVNRKQILADAETAATDAALAAGQAIKAAFGQAFTFQEKGEHGDLVTEVDHIAEELILSRIRTAFPNHRIRSEEAGDNAADSSWLWLVDPLDGTNNFAVGMPLFGVSITLLQDEVPELAVIYEPMAERLYVSVRGQGVRCNGKPVALTREKPFKAATMGWIQGHGVQKDAAALRLRHHLEEHSKRVMRLWAPTLQWSMLARGDLDAIVLYHSEGEDLYSGVLTVLEAGGIVMDYEGRPFSGMSSEPYLIACRPGHREYFLEMVQGGLSSRTSS